MPALIDRGARTRTGRVGSEGDMDLLLTTYVVSYVKRGFIQINSKQRSKPEPSSHVGLRPFTAVQPRAGGSTGLASHDFDVRL